MHPLAFTIVYIKNDIIYMLSLTGARSTCAAEVPRALGAPRLRARTAPRFALAWPVVRLRRLTTTCMEDVGIKVCSASG